MANIAVIAHADKTFGGGLTELREILTREGYPDPLWYEIKTSSKAPKCARRALAEGAEVIFVWGGDGTVQLCIDALAETKAVVAILPAGTANILAGNLNIPIDIPKAVSVGPRRQVQQEVRRQIRQGQDRRRSPRQSLVRPI